jgi:hypothetical protein
VRHVQFGEGDYDKTEAAIRTLLRDAGARLGGDARPDRTFDPASRATPETYLGLARAQAYVVPPASGTKSYVPAAPDRIPANGFTLGGTWTLSQESARAGAGATLAGRVAGKDVYLVLSPPQGGKGSVQVLLDGRPIAASAAGRDVHDGRVTVDRQRLYHLVSRPGVETHVLTLRFTPGVAGFAFTFG